MKKLAFALVTVCAAIHSLQAVNVTVRNFDDDLATVYVNGTATTNGQVVAVDGNVEVWLKDFRSDYYFRYAPASQTDRTLGFESWEGVPAGYETANPATFAPSGDLTVTPNVDVKGFCWQLDTGTRRIDDGHFCWGCAGTAANYKNDAARTIQLGVCVTNWWVTEATTKVKNHVLDCVERVRYNGKNYTISGLNAAYCFDYSRVGTLVVPPKCTSYATNLTYGNATYACVTNVVGFYDLTTATIGAATFIRSCASFSGPATNFVPRRAASFADYPYTSAKISGELLLEEVTTIGPMCFQNCSSLTSLRITSSKLTSISSTAFSGCSKMKELTFTGDLSKWTTLSTTAFGNAITNVNFTANPPSAAILDNLLSSQSSTVAAKNCKFSVDETRANWWSLVSSPLASEVAAGLPPNCMGVYASGNDRKAWIVGLKPINGILLEGDMSMSGNAGFVPHAGLENGSQVEMTAPAGYDQCLLQHQVDGQWVTYETVRATSFTYTHGTEIVRAVWSVDGAKLATKVNSYGGNIAISLVSGKELSSGVYEKGSVVRLTATGAATHPTSHFNGWTSGVTGDDATNAVVDITITEDVEAFADFYPDEWIYTNATMITDGEWKITASSLANGELSVNAASGGQNGVLWIDFSLPVRPYNDLTTNYVITAMNCTPTACRRLKLGPKFRTFSGTHFVDSTVLEDIYGLGGSSVTVFPYAFLCRCGSSPLHSKVYEANFFIPPGLQTIASSCDLSGAPFLKGTLELNDVRDFANFNMINNLLWNDTYGVGVTNVRITAEKPTNIPYGVVTKAHAESATIGMTNLLTAGTGVFYYYYDKGKYWCSVKDFTFLAHAPTVAALDNILFFNSNTSAVIRCSKHAPGWKELRMVDYWKQPEWAGRPAGTWGIYQTTTGHSTQGNVRRFYLVQRDSKYDRRSGLTVLVR